MSLGDFLDTIPNALPDPVKSVLSPIGPLFRKTKKAYFSNQPDQVRSTKYGFDLLIDPSIKAERAFASGNFESEVAMYFSQQSQEKEMFVDIGANIGIYSLLFLSSSPPTAKVEAFEPLPRNASRLKLNTYLNEFEEHINIHKTAVGNKSGTVQLQTPSENHAEATLSDELYSGKSSGRIEVQIERLDKVLSQDEYPDLMKIDVEGAERAVFEGCVEILETQPEILLEIHPTVVNGYDEHIQQIETLLMDAGYDNAFHINTNRNLKISELSSFEGRETTHVYLS